MMFVSKVTLHSCYIKSKSSIWEQVWKRISFIAASTTSVTFTLQFQIWLCQKLFPELSTVDHKISIHSPPYTQDLPFQITWQDGSELFHHGTWQKVLTVFVVLKRIKFWEILGQFWDLLHNVHQFPSYCSADWNERIKIQNANDSLRFRRMCWPKHNYVMRIPKKCFQ